MISENACKLDFEINADVLKDELYALEKLPWFKESPYIADNVPGLNTTVYHSGNWQVISLRSLGGDAERTDPGGPNIDEYEDTRWMQNTPYIKSIISHFNGAVRTVRLSSMGEGMKIARHCDTFVGLQYGQIRLHIPVETNPDVTVQIDEESFHWSEGELWFGDFAKPHSVVNGGSTRRVHLIFDVYITDYVLSLFPAAVRSAIAAENILMYSPGTDLSVTEKQKFVCEFYVSAALLKGIFETDDGVYALLQGEVKLVGEDLQFWLENKPLFAMEPIEENTFKLRSWTNERTIEFSMNDGGSVEQMIWSFYAGKHKTTVTMPVQSKALDTLNVAK